MLKNKIILKIVGILGPTVFFLMGCTADEQPTFDEARVNIEPLDEYHLDTISEGDIRYFLGVSTLDLELEPTEDYYGLMEVNGADHPLVANIGNLSTEDLNYVLKVFVNYEEVPFRVLGEDEYVTEFMFFLESGYQMDIPFVVDVSFPDDHYTYKLTAGVFVDPSREVINEENYWEVFSWSQGMVLNSDLILGSGSDIYFELPQQTEPMERQEDTWFVDLIIAQEFTLNEHGFLSPPEFVQQVRRGEDIEFSFYASPLASYGYELENYLIIGMLDWQQIPLNGYHPYLFIDAQDQEFEQLLDYGVFTLEAIDEVGFYDFIAVLIPNPRNPNSLENSYPLMKSNRFVIEVVE